VESIYIVQVISKYKPALNIMKYMEIYSMIHSDSKASPKADNINNAEHMAKPEKAESAVKADSAKINCSAKSV
jgi:hypothetical protein